MEKNLISCSNYAAAAVCRRKNIIKCEKEKICGETVK
jgi:hypothetical protein